MTILEFLEKYLTDMFEDILKTINDEIDNSEWYTQIRLERIEDKIEDWQKLTLGGSMMSGKEEGDENTIYYFDEERHAICVEPKSEVWKRLAAIEEEMRSTARSVERLWKIWERVAKAFGGYDYD